MDLDRSNHYSLRRREVVKLLLDHRDSGLLIVSGLGAPTWDVTAAGDEPLNFPLWGAMGGAVSIGLGLAIAQPTRRILVITGDGEMLMGLGSLATVSIQSPSNFAILVLDNERYGETGMQKTHTAFGVDLPAVAAAVGFYSVETVTNNKELDKAFPKILGGLGPLFCSIKVRAESLDFVLPPNDGVILKNRMRKALL